MNLKHLSCSITIRDLLTLLHLVLGLLVEGLRQQTDKGLCLYFSYKVELNETATRAKMQNTL